MHMSHAEQIARLERLVESLSREKRAAMEALNLASALGNFDLSHDKCTDPQHVMRELSERAHSMLKVTTVAVYLNDEQTHDFTLAHCDYPEHSDRIEYEVESLIKDHSFAWTLRRNRPAFFLSSDKRHNLLLHVLATTNRIHGMFVGLLAQDKSEIPDTTLALLTVVMMSGSHALENAYLCRRLEESNRTLEEKVERRTRLLQESNTQMQTIFQSIPAGIVLVDATTKVVAQINEPALRMLGTTREQVLGKPCDKRFCDGARDCIVCLDNSTSTSVCDRTITSLDGGTINVIRAAVPIQLGGRSYLLESFVDVTEQQKLARLREDVEQITRHDLKTPLNGIIALPDVLLNMHDIRDQEVRGILKMIKEAGLKMLRMINMSHDLFKMENDSYVFTPSEVNLPPLLRSTLMELDDLRSSRKLDVRILVQGVEAEADTSFFVLGEELLTYSMLSNLIKNALEASPRQGIITIRLDRDMDTGEAVIRIHNMGAVPEALRGNFFDKYATLDKNGGSGIGTYSARLIARTMKGDITYTTSEEQGTTLTVRLPLPGPAWHV